jgi:hypothetical protein
MAKEIKIDETSYLMLLNKILTNKEEERDLALDRYRKADESMTNNEHFMLLGKNAAAFLRQASDITNDIMALSKEIKSIIYKENNSDSSNKSPESNDAEMRAIIDAIKQQEKELGINYSTTNRSSTDIESENED